MPNPEDQLRQRLELERPILVRAFPRAELLAEDKVVILRDHRLPPGWSHELTDVLFTFPANFPAGCPDSVCARRDLTLANGNSPASTQGIQTHAGREWLQFSWHVDAGDWRPTVDPAVGSNLVTYLVGALGRFEEAS